MPRTSQEDKRMANTPDFTVKNSIIQREGLRSRDKRPYNNITAPETVIEQENNSNDTKQVKAIIIILA